MKRWGRIEPIGWAIGSELTAHCITIGRDVRSSAIDAEERPDRSDFTLIRGSDLITYYLLLIT